MFEGIYYVGGLLLILIGSVFMFFNGKSYKKDLKVTYSDIMIKNEKYTIDAIFFAMYKMSKEGNLIFLEESGCFKTVKGFKSESLIENNIAKLFRRKKL